VPDEDLVIIGRLGRSRGVAGDIWVTPQTDFPERFVDLKRIYIAGSDGWRSYEVTRAHLIGGRPVIHLAGFDSREDVARMTNRDLAVPRSGLVPIEDGDTHYVFDLNGCRIFAGDDMEPLGVLEDVERYPANDVYVIRLTSGRLVRLPAVKSFVLEIDTANKRIVIDPAGLVE
jgi:16S rRNA processing protein RimM